MVENYFIMNKRNKDISAFNLYSREAFEENKII